MVLARKPQAPSIALTLWEQIPEGKEHAGMLRCTGGRAVTEIMAELSKRLRRTKMYRDLDYFNTSIYGDDWPGHIEQKPTEHGDRPVYYFPCSGMWRVACWACEGGSEGYYFHIEVQVPREVVDEPEKVNTFNGRLATHRQRVTYTMALGKTLYEGERGWKIASRCADFCARQLGG